MTLTQTECTHGANHRTRYRTFRTSGRVEKMLANLHNDWLDGAFTESEQSGADAPPNTAQYFAARFAAKEAVVKALGTGFTDDVTWLDIEVRRKPTVVPPKCTYLEVRQWPPKPSALPDGL